MEYDPLKHNRRSIRLKGYDYSSEGAYHVVVRTKNGKCVFGDIETREMKLSPFGEIAQKCWKEIPEQFRNVELDQYVVMPNHIHGIVVITSLVRAIHESPIPGPLAPSSTPEKKSPVLRTSPPTTALERRKMLLPKIIGRFKMKCAKHINELRGTSGDPFWQRGYYEHIIRDGQDLDRIRQYILDNPMNWGSDDNHPSNIHTDLMHDETAHWSALD